MVFMKANELKARLVHHTGTMLRFTTSQLRYLPDSDRDVVVTTPDGNELHSRFHYHRANPYVGGKELVNWIKRLVEVPYGKPESVLAVADGDRLGLRFLDGDKEQGKGGISESVRKISRKLRRGSPKRKRRILWAWERDPKLRKLVLGLWDHRCQVEGCNITSTLPAELRHCVLDVHHLNHISQGGEHNDALNVCLICSGHHSVIHRIKDSEVLNCTATRAVIQIGNAKLKIVRNVAPLLRALS